MNNQSLTLTKYKFATAVNIEAATVSAMFSAKFESILVSIAAKFSGLCLIGGFRQRASVEAACGRRCLLIQAGRGTWISRP